MVRAEFHSLPRLLIKFFHFALLALLAFVGAARGQQPPVATSALDPDKIVASTIGYVPPLAQSVLARDREKVSKLLEAREDPDDRVVGKNHNAGFTPLILAATLSDTAIAQLLIRGGAKITAVDDFNRTAFWYAVLREDIQMTSELIKAPGAKEAEAVKEAVNIADNELKRAPLHIAVHGSTPEIVQLLLQAGASTELKDILEETPIEFCKRNPTKACTGF